LEKLISKISGIGNVLTIQEGSVEVEYAPGKDIRPEIARNVIKAGFDLLELKSIDLSLEDIFIQLTREEPEPPSTDDSDEES
jgi:ABC-2 type transport system ATP-binding protein